MKTNNLSLSWSTSRAAATYGWNVCRLDDQNSGARYKTSGGGYDMRGTVVGFWLMAEYKDRISRLNRADFYGISATGDLDGACGLDCMLRIGEAIGLKFEREYIPSGRRRGETTGWFIIDTALDGDK